MCDVINLLDFATGQVGDKDIHEYKFHSQITN